jgi:TRAP-type C4-dicarboxylate transport system substrate-binding protein
MNKDVWNSMPPNIQDDIMSVSGQIPSVIYAVANELITDESREDLVNIDEKLGNQPIYVPTEDELAQWTDIVNPVWQKWIDELAKSNSPHADKGQEILDFIAAQVAQYGTYYEDYRDEAQKILDARFE